MKASPAPTVSATSTGTAGREAVALRAEDRRALPAPRQHHQPRRVLRATPRPAGPGRRPGAIQARSAPLSLITCARAKKLVEAGAVVPLVLDQARADVGVEADDAPPGLAPHQLGEGVRRRLADQRQRAEMQRLHLRADRRHVLEAPVPRRGALVVEGVARLLAVEIDEGQHGRPVEPRHVVERDAVLGEALGDRLAEEIRGDAADEADRHVEPRQRERDVAGRPAVGRPEAGVPSRASVGMKSISVSP